MLVSLFIGIWIARYLGPTEYGIFSYANAFVALFTVFATLGMNDIVIKKLVKDVNKRDYLLGTSFYLKVLGSLFALVICGFVTKAIESDQNTRTYIMIIATSMLFQNFNVIDLYFQSKSSK